MIKTYTALVRVSHCVVVSNKFDPGVGSGGLEPPSSLRRLYSQIVLRSLSKFFVQLIHKAFDRAKIFYENSLTQPISLRSLLNINFKSWAVTSFHFFIAVVCIITMKYRYHFNQQAYFLLCECLLVVASETIRIFDSQAV